ncbi:hypothetical protein HY629_01320, partial [Candidatus Uhrbacteria bacterium]|nr:hypothetical protein [Candidatus Uhrbacteria bacterium]
MLSTREQSSFVPQDTQPTPAEAVLGIHRNDLQPEVRAYADNLREQVRDIWKAHGVRSVDEFEAAARKKKIPLETVREVHALLEALRDTVETGEITEQKELYAVGAALVQDARARTRALDDPDEQSQLFTTLASIEAAVGGTPDDDIVAAKRAIQALDEWQQGVRLRDLATAEIAMGRDPEATIDTALEVVRYLSHEDFVADLYVLRAKAGHDVSVSTLPQFKHNTVLAKTCADIAAAYAAQGKNAVPFVEEAKRLEATFSDINDYASSQLLLSIAKIEMQLGKMKDAKDTAARIPELSMRVAALAHVVDTQVRAGVDASETIQLMKRAAQEKKSKKMGSLRGSLFLDIVRAEARAGLPYQGSLEKAKVMAQDGGMTGPFLFRNIASVEQTLGLDPTQTLNRARKAISRLSNAQEEAQEYTHLAKGEGELGRDPGPTLTLARRSALLNINTNAPDRDQQLVDIVEVYAKTHAVQAAHAILRDIQTSYRRDDALAAIAAAEIEIGDVQNAEKT